MKPTGTDPLVAELQRQYPVNFPTADDAEPVAGRIKDGIGHYLKPPRDAIVDALDKHGVGEKTDAALAAIESAYTPYKRQPATDHYEWVCRNPECHLPAEQRVNRMWASHAADYKARLESAYGDIVRCDCGAEMVERRVNVDDSAYELLPDGRMYRTSADGKTAHYAGKMKLTAL